MPFLNRVDNNILLEHYKRIYNAKPSPEIARTRPSNKKRRIIPNTAISRSVSYQSIYDGGSSLGQRWDRNPDVGYFNGSQGNLSDNHLFHSTRMSFPDRGLSKWNQAHDQGMDTRAYFRSNPKQRRPSSAVIQTQNYEFSPYWPGGKQPSSSSALHSMERLKNHYVDNEHKKYTSMENLYGDAGPNKFHDPRLYFSQTSLNQFDLRPATSLSERIDLFLQAVKFEQEELLLRQQIQRPATTTIQKRLSGSSKVSRTQRNTSIRKTSYPSVSSFASKPKPTMKTRQPLQTWTPKTVDKSKITRPMTAPAEAPTPSSRLAQDRNYQPPRMKRQPSIDTFSKTNVNRTQKDPLAHAEAYQYNLDRDEDFEDEGSDYSVLRQKQDWLYDQFQRVEARQRAALMIKRQEIGGEKASSKDSAYGYSGCETSRLHTREPTPDHHGIFTSGFPKGFARNPFRQKHASAKLNNTIPTHRVGHPPQSARPKQDVKRVKINTTYLKIVSEVTNEILKSSSFTEHSIKRILEQHLSRTKGKHNLSKSEIEELFIALKCELGLESSKTIRGIQDLLMSDEKLSSKPNQTASTSSKIRKKIYPRGLSSSDSNYSGHILPSKILPTKHRRQIRVEDSESFDESEILRLLREETDLDDSLVEDIYKASLFSQKNRQRQEMGQTNPAKKSEKIENLNISKLDSFTKSKNSLNGFGSYNKGRGKLVKSFSIQGKEQTGRTESPPNQAKSKNKPKEGRVDALRSSSIVYQTDDESKDISEEIPDGQDSDTNGDESVEEPHFS